MARSNFLRTIAGFVIAPIVPGALIAAVLLALSDSEMAEFVILANVYFGYPVALLIGAPIHFALLRGRLTHRLAYAGAGAAIGAFLYFAVPALIDGLMALQGVGGGQTMFTANVLPLGMVCGAVATSVFWLIVRPDQQLKLS